MQEISYNGVKKILLVVALTAASVLACVLYHLVASPRAVVYGAPATGNVDVSIEVKGGNVFGPPRIDDIGPLSGPVGGGTILTITGDNLDGVTEVDLGGGYKCAPITHVSNTEIKCKTPPHLDGYVNVTIVAPGYGSFTKDNGFRYITDGSGLPGVPNTGLFRLGKHIITLYDILLILFTIVLLWAVIVRLFICKRPRRRETGEKN